MAINWSDTLRVSENRATSAALNQVPAAMALQNAIAHTGSVQNTVGTNADPDAVRTNAGGTLLRCNTVFIGVGLLAS